MTPHRGPEPDPDRDGVGCGEQGRDGAGRDPATGDAAGREDGRGGAGRDDTERLARVAWARISEPGDTDAAEIVAQAGHVEGLDRVRAGDLGRGRPFADRLRRIDPAVELERAGRLGCRLVVPADAEWPAGLDDLERPPHVLWVRGEVDLATVLRRSVSVVGARAATHYGLQVATDLAAGLAERGFAVVSGAAYGIDAAAHRGALLVDGLTVAALACGVDRAYPAAHHRLLARIAAQGAVLSELPPGEPPYASRFLQRNRLIAAVSQGTVVVEAGLRSGSLNTIRTAERLGRQVAAVPGPVTSAVSAGCHQAVRDLGAQLVTDAAELAELVGRIGDDLAPLKRVAAHDETWSDTDRLVHGRVPVRGPLGLDALVTALGLPASTVLAALGRLEVAGAVRRRDDGWQKAPAPRPAPAAR